MGVCHQEECQEGTRHPGEPENISLLESKVKDISWPGGQKWLAATKKSAWRAFGTHEEPRNTSC